MNDTIISDAARAIRDCDALLITAGAGIGVDSGLPDFRGKEGFWRAYPPLEKLDLSFEQMASPTRFARQPSLAWGFYGHRLNLYRNAVPHVGFAVLRSWADIKEAKGGHFVFTSNVDGHFARAGFAETKIVECHGSIHHLQCRLPCCEDIWSAGNLHMEVDETTLRAVGDLPRCRRCGGIARPNLLMFDDFAWQAERTVLRQSDMEIWLSSLQQKGLSLAIVEVGAGTAIPTVRHLGEYWAMRGATLIRINPHDASVPTGQIGIPAGARETLCAIDERLSG